MGSVWFLREETLGRPSPAETRMLLATSEQIAQGIRRDRLADQATDLEVAIRSDELKSALLDSVSHDLRTPLASIRAAAGNLADSELAWSVEEQRSAARDIDDQAERLSGLVTALLDMSRIRSGALRAEPEVLPADDLVRGVLARTSLFSRLLITPLTPLLPNQQREHQWLAATVFSEGNRSLALLSGVPEQDRAAAQSTPTEDLGLRNSCR